MTTDGGRGGLKRSLHRNSGFPGTVSVDDDFFLCTGGVRI